MTSTFKKEGFLPFFIWGRHSDFSAKQRRHFYAHLICTNHVHDAEGLLELLDSGVGEGVEDVGFLGHVEAGGSERELGDLKFGP